MLLNQMHACSIMEGILCKRKILVIASYINFTQFLSIVYTMYIKILADKISPIMVKLTHTQFINMHSGVL